MVLMPVESSVPETVSVLPVMWASARSSVDPLATDTVPVPVLLTVRLVSFSVLLSIAWTVPVLSMSSPLMSSRPPSASSVPALVIVKSVAGSIVSVPPAVDSIVPVAVMVMLAR